MQLQQIRGITKEIAKGVQQSLLDREADEQFTIELKKILAGRGFPKSLFRQLKGDYGTAAAVEIRKNPYILLR